MSNLKNKSEINRSAADLLQQKSLYPSVVHCSYYSCVQLMKHILLFVFGKTELELKNETRSSNEGSHEIIINTITTHLKNNNKDWRTFNSNINQLKKLRVAADYENIPIDSSKGRDSINLSDVVLKNLKSNIRL